MVMAKPWLFTRWEPTSYPLDSLGVGGAYVKISLSVFRSAESFATLHFAGGEGQDLRFFSSIGQQDIAESLARGQSKFDGRGNGELAEQHLPQRERGAPADSADEHHPARYRASILYQCDHQEFSQEIIASQIFCEWYLRASSDRKQFPAWRGLCFWVLIHVADRPSRRTVAESTHFRAEWDWRRGSNQHHRDNASIIYVIYNYRVADPGDGGALGQFGVVVDVVDAHRVPARLQRIRKLLHIDLQQRQRDSTFPVNVEWACVRVGIVPPLQFKRVLPPVGVRLSEVVAPVAWTADQFVEVRHTEREGGGHAQGRVGQAPQRSSPDPPGPRPVTGHHPTCPDEKERQGRHRIAEVVVETGLGANEGQKAQGEQQQQHFVPPDEQSAANPHPNRQGDDAPQADGLLDGQPVDVVVPPPTPPVLSPQIRHINLRHFEVPFLEVEPRQVSRRKRHRNPRPDRPTKPVPVCRQVRVIRDHPPERMAHKPV